MGGGAPITIPSKTPDLKTAADALPPGTQFEVQVVGVISPTQNSPPSNTLRFVTAAAGAPGVTGTPTSPTTANIPITPATGTWQQYHVKLCPVKGGTCVEFDCPANNLANCKAQGLQPDTT